MSENNATLSIDHKEIVLPASNGEVDILPLEPIDQETMLAIAYLDCGDIREAAREVGYTESTIRSGYIKNKLNNPVFHQKIRDAAVACDFQHLSLVYQLESKALERANEETEKDNAIDNVSKLKHIAAQKKKITGILRDDIQAPGQVTINANVINQFWSNAIPEAITVEPEGDET